MMPESIEPGWLPAGIGAIAGLGAMWMHIRRQLSQDGTAARSDDSTREQISRLEAEITRKDAALLARESEVANLRALLTAAERKNVHLDTENVYLSRDRDRLMRDFKKMVNGLPDEVKDDLETDWAALAAVDERIEPGRR